MPTRVRCLAILICWASALASAGPAPDDQSFPTIRHELEVRLSPANHYLEAEDVVSFLTPTRLTREPLQFLLHAGLEVESADPAYRLTAVPGGLQLQRSGIDRAGVTLRTYQLQPASGTWPPNPKPRLRFRGEIHHPLVEEQENYARSFSRTPGIIDERGVVLSGSSFWVPWFGDGLMSFRLTVTVPESWDVVSQGERILHELRGNSRQVSWDSPEAMEEIYLIAGRFTEYSRTAANVTAYAFLRKPDPNLAAKYLEVTAQYMEMYRQLIGPYPYKKFALVENFWETGYGMPSFTLLGPKIIRFPFILHSSYPHEILHNWLGNGVYVDYQQGNWSEGLTAYLADHLIKEQRGQGSDYRRDTLNKYRNYVRGEQDFPLAAFRARHSSASEAVGYGKSLMLWHMLRLQLGDDNFIRGLQRFYRQYRFRQASYADLNKVFSQVAEQDLTPFFQQWVERSGAPELSLRSETLGENRLKVTVRQDEPGESYRLTVPLAVTLAGEPQARLFPINLKGRESSFEFTLPAPVLRLDLDPYFDVFRRLQRQEIPATLSELFGADSVIIVLPRDDEAIDLEAWRNVARAWSQGSAHRVEVVQEQDLQQLPDDRAGWILGTHNRWRHAVLASVNDYGAGLEGGEIVLNGTKWPEANHSFVYTARHPDNPELALGWVGADLAAALPGLARKLPHYGKYSYLAFAGDEPSNVAKGQWPALDSPLVNMVHRPQASNETTLAVTTLTPRAALPARQPLARLAPVFDPNQLAAHVEYLASDDLEGRGVGTEGLRKAGDYIAQRFQRSGLQPGGDDGSYFQSWSEPDGLDGKSLILRNVIGVLPGSKTEWQDQSVVLSAHYDHLGRGWPDVRTGEEGKIHNGADDNASGVAVLLELAALLGEELEPERSIVFVAFSGEEWGRKGSRHYVKAMQRWPADQSLAMINLDTVGRLKGKKLMMLGAGSASEWIHIARGVGFTTGIEATAVLDDPGGSDQQSFHAVGIPAVQLFTGAHADFHRSSDDADKIDIDGLVKVATFVRETLVYLSERDRPLTAKLAAATTRPRTAGPVAARRVTLGTVPDFAYPGPGVRADSVIPDSPAAVAGLQGGDILVAINDARVTDLKTFADILKQHRPGDRVRIQVRRGAEVLTLEAKLVVR